MSNFFLESVKEEPLTSLNDRNDLSRMAYQNKSSDIPVRNNSMKDRFAPLEDNFINHKESFEKNNERINSLNEDIRELKEKLKSVYEKDEQILSLKSECETLRLKCETFDDLKNEIRFIGESNDRLRGQMDDLRSDNRLLKERQEDEKGRDKDDDVEKIIVDVHKIKIILSTRLKDYHEKHIDDLIRQYDLTEKKEIDRPTMEKILLQAIHV